MRRCDLGSGRVAAVAAIVCVALASPWPLAAAAGVATGAKSAIDDGMAHRVTMVETSHRDDRVACDAAAAAPPIADPHPLTAARDDLPDASTIVMLAVSLVTVALMALLSRSDAMTERFYSDVG